MKYYIARLRILRKKIDKEVRQNERVAKAKLIPSITKIMEDFSVTDDDGKELTPTDLRELSAGQLIEILDSTVKEMESYL